MGAPLQAGVIGLGILGSQHAKYLQTHEQVDVVAVADIRAETAQALAASVGAKPYTDYGDMLAQETLDLIVVATPDPLHREPVLAALKAGVPNVIQEKPLATTRADALEIYEVVEQKRAKLYVNYANRASPLDIATRYVIQQGLLGSVHYGESRLDDNISVPTQMWGKRTRDWAAGSSTAHFLLSHVVDLLRWYFNQDVTEVYAISQDRVLGYTPDLYDAYLTFDGGLQIRAKAEWIKHIDELVEFYMCFSGSEGTLIYNKRGGFGTEPGWRANLAQSTSTGDLRAHQEALLAEGVNVGALLHRPTPMAGELKAGGDTLAAALEYRGLGYGQPMALVGCFIDSILQDTPEPTSWQNKGPLPTHEDGLEQTLIVDAIIRSSQTHQAVQVAR